MWYLQSGFGVRSCLGGDYKYTYNVEASQPFCGIVLGIHIILNEEDHQKNCDFGVTAKAVGTSSDEIWIRNN